MVFIYIPLPPDQHHISDVAMWMIDYIDWLVQVAELTDGIGHAYA